MKLAMFAGSKRHYVIDYIRGQHFVQVAERAGVSPTLAEEALQEIGDTAVPAITTVEKQLPSGFPVQIHSSVSKALLRRLQALLAADAD